ncbi:PKD domain-containing protein, partial [Crocinitomix catalasitica]|uniref:PKD domain-containing protein n=1 Tax=Crocinitomix catalasitica TaxID=184607 RepID=UPI000566CE3F
MKTYLNIIYTLLLLIPFGVFGQVVNTTPVNLVGSSDPIPGPGPFGLHPFTPSPLTGTYHGGVFFGGTREKWGYEISDLTIGDTYTLTVYYMMDLTFGTPAYDRIGNLTLLSGAPLDIPTIPYVPEPDWRNWYTMEVTFTAVDVTDRIDIEADGLSDNSLWLYTDMSIDGDGACDELTTTVSATDICIGDLVTLEASSTNGGTVTWSDGVVDGVSFPLATAGVFSYTATSDNEDDCVFEVDITVHEPDVTAAVDDDVICLGETAIFTGGGADTYSWDMGVTNGTAFEPLAAGNFTHTVTGTDAFGCTNTATVDLFVSPLPRVDLEFIADGVSSEDGSTGGCIINAVQFNDLSTISDLGDITGWEWRFGDGSTSSLENPDHTYGAAGTYNVTLTVTTADGCTATYTTTITMVESITIDIISNEPSCFGFSDGSIIINILGGGGGDDVVYEIKDVDGNVLNIDNSNAANSLKAGTYTYTIGDGTACSGEGTVTLSQPEQLDIDITTFDPLCFGDKTGWARINEVFNATGDNDRISYIWNPNPTGNSGIGADSIWNLGFGEYTITINDENGCSNVFDFMIDQPKVLEFVELGYEPAYCRLYDYQKGNGVVKAAMIGGVADYGYLWTNLQTG